MRSVRVQIPQRLPSQGFEMKIYGPYVRKDGRKHMIILNDDGTRTTKSFPRYLMEQYLGRELAPNETVDHINEDFTDDRFENLQVLTRSENAKKQMMTEPRKRKYFKFICPICKKQSSKYLNHVENNLKKGSRGPFCSRVCAGKAGKK